MLAGLKNKFHWMKNLFLRRIRGFGCCDLDSLFQFQAERNAKELRAFRSAINSHPEDITLEEWYAAVDEMIWAFEFHAKDTWDRDQDEFARAQRGLEQYARYFTAIWN